MGSLAVDVARVQSASVLFGEHLLPMNRGKPVAIVESEKTALVAAYYLPEYVWLASGGKTVASIPMHSAFSEVVR